MRVVFSPDGLTGGAYILGVNCEELPDAAVEISDAEWNEFITRPGSRKWDGSKIVAVLSGDQVDAV